MPRAAGRPIYPLRLEEAYQRRLLRVPRVAHRLLMDRLGPLMRRLGPDIDARARGDSAASDLAEILRVVGRVREATEKAAGASVSEDELAGIAAKVDRFAAAELTRVLALDVTQGGKLTSLYQAWAAENVALIESIPAQFFAEIETTVKDAVQSGRLTRDVMKDLQGRYGVSKSRAELIARDQIGKLNGQLTEQRQTSLGITEYIWSTSKDRRVRDMHADLEGTVQRWDDPPVTNENGDRNHPGGDYQCRCVSVPILPT